MIYFDNAATSFPKPHSVASAVAYAINNFGNAGRGFYDISIDASKSIIQAREKTAKLFNLDKIENVAFTSSVTESLNLVINSFLNKDDHVIISHFEHNSVLRPLYKKGCEISIIKNPDEIETNVKKNTKAIIINHASNFSGDIFDIDKVGEICEKKGILFIVDAAQTAGFLDIDVKKSKVDILCFTGHKSLLGPQGVGGICVNSEKFSEITPVKVGGSGFNSFEKAHSRKMPECFEAGTINCHSIYGFSEALDYIQKYSLSKIRNKEIELADYFYSNLKQIKNSVIYGDFENKLRCPIIAFNIGDISSDDVSLELYEKGEIASRSGTHCAPLIHKYHKLENQGAIRFSFSYTNTKEQIDKALEIISDISYYFHLDK